MIITQQTIKEKFESVSGWTTQFNIQGVEYGGGVSVLANDPRLHWHIKTIGGLKGKMVLELGPLEGAHTKTMLEAGAIAVIAVEGNKDCYERCLIVQDVFELGRAMFVHDDFNNYVSGNSVKFDVVSAAGVLYHQLDPASLIRKISRITDTVLVWSQVASEDHPDGNDDVVNGYRGKWQHYKNAREDNSYCGGMNDKSFWMYPTDMIRCFRDAGLTEIIEHESPPNVNGDSLFFVAKRGL